MPLGSPGLKSETLHLSEVGVTRRKIKIVFERGRGDPDIILRNWAAALPQLNLDSAIHLGRPGSHGENRICSGEIFDLEEVALSLF
jgi:hypothetical protein